VSDGTDVVLDSPELSSFWDAVKEAELIGSGGGGTICQIRISFGWKVWPPKESGFTNQQTYFSYEVSGNKKETQANSAVAKGKANKFILENGLEKNAYNVFCIAMFKDTVLNKNVDNWQGDSYRFFFPSGKTYTDLIAPKMREAKVSSLGEMWARVSYLPDPDPKARKRQVQKKNEDGSPMIDPNTGEPMFDTEDALAPYIAQVYASKDEAIEAAGGSDATDGMPKENVTEFPEGYDAASWAVIVEAIKGERASDVPLPKIANDYGLDMAWVTKAINS
jgi:hypothetical protein